MFRNQKIVFILIICLVAVAKSFGANKTKDSTYQINCDPQFDSMNVPARDFDVFEALNIWKLYILERNDSLLCQDSETTEIKEQVKEQLFSKSYPAQNVIFHIIAYQKTNQGFIIENAVQFVKPEWEVNYILSYFRIGVKKQKGQYKLFFLVQEYLNGCAVTNTKWFDYYTNPKFTLEKNAMAEANRFCDSVAKIFDIKPEVKAKYIVTEKNRTYEVFGHYFYWGASGSIQFNIGKQRFILDNQTNGNYRHEITHYLFSEFSSIKILSEGLATWLGGTTSFQTYQQAIDTLKKLPYKDTTELNRILKRKLPYWQATYTYAIGGIIIESIYKKYGPKVVLDLLYDKSSTDVLDLITKYFKLINQDPKDFLIQLITAK